MEAALRIRNKRIFEPSRKENVVVYLLRAYVDHLITYVNAKINDRMRFVCICV